MVQGHDVFVDVVIIFSPVETVFFNSQPKSCLVIDEIQLF